MKRPGRQILLTGARGYVGAAIHESLVAAGHSVHCVVRGATGGAAHWYSLDLTEGAEVRALADRLHPDVIVHAAAGTNLARRNSSDGTDANVRMVANLVRAFAERNVCFIHLSSISVYGEDGRSEPLSLSTEPNPATAYARSKWEAERALVRSSLKRLHILRLGPVFSENRLRNVRVRATLPLLGWGLRLNPEPLHSLTRLSSAVDAVLARTRVTKTERAVANVVEALPFSQGQLLEMLGPQRIVSVPGAPFALLHRMVSRLPGNRARTLAELCWKLHRGIRVTAEARMIAPELWQA